MGLVSKWSLASHLACAHIWSDSGSFLVDAHLSAKMDSSEKDSGRLIGHMDWHLLPPFGPSRILPVSFWWQHLVSYQDLLLPDNSSKWLSLCLAKAGGFSQRFPNIISCNLELFLSLSFSLMALTFFEIIGEPFLEYSPIGVY